LSDSPRLYHPRPRDVEPQSANLAAELNPEQAAAATYGKGPLLIIAGAGTGKTRTLVYRVAHLIERGTPPERILLLTFTRRSAQEMLSRCEQLVGSASQRVHGGTFHATAHRLLRRFGASAGLPSDFTIMDQSDATDLMQISRAALGYAEKGKRFPKKETLQYLYSRHVNTERSVNELLEEEYPHFSEYEDDIARIFADYTSRKGERNLVDYDDLLLFWAMLLENSPELSAKISALYDHVLVDEYQDTNVLQARILQGMCRTHRNLTVVGDDAQSIYSFRGASFRNILDFPRQFPETAIVTLERNYRSTAPILETTNTLISRATERYTKSLWTAREGGERPWLVAARDESSQTRFVVDRILELHEEGIRLSEMSVLFRAGYMSADLEVELGKRKIPFVKWGGIKFLETAHVKDVLAFLRVLENPRDEVSWYRLLLLLPGVGEATARATVDAIAQGGWRLQALAEHQPPPRAREWHAKLAALMRQLADRIDRGESSSAGADIALVRQRVYDSLLREKFDQAQPRLADLDELEKIASGYGDRASFLSALALEPPTSTQDVDGTSEQEDDALVLSTAHSAKGREWDVVFVLWAVDGWFPMARALSSEEEEDEERRLMYVAMTRARDHLMVTYPLHAYSSRVGSDYAIDQVSRFIDAGVRETMQRVVLADEVPEPSPVPSPNAGGIDLRALLRGRFRGA
jgi:DNA helicase-2/ATP-dependent DNA helicase PcrA